MIRKMVVAALMLLAVPAFVNAQNTVTATATIAQSAVVTGSGDLAFGTLTGAASISADGGAGSAARTVTFNHNINVSFNNVPSALTSGANSLPIALTCAFQTGATWSAVSPCSSASFNIGVGASQSTATLGFGGSIAAGDYATAVAGSYAGTFDIVVVAQ